MRTTLRILGVAMLPPLAVLAGVGLTMLAWDRSPKRVASWSIARPLEQTLVVRKQIMARDAITREVMASEMTLFEAAAWFHRINEEAGYHQHSYWERLPGKSDEEKTCRQVILWVRIRLYELHQTHEEVDAVVRPLEKQLEDHIAAHGQVILPMGSEEEGAAPLRGKLAGISRER